MRTFADQVQVELAEGGPEPVGVVQRSGARAVGPGDDEGVPRGPAGLGERDLEEPGVVESGRLDSLHVDGRGTGLPDPRQASVHPEHLVGVGVRAVDDGLQRGVQRRAAPTRPHRSSRSTASAGMVSQSGRWARS